jgi:hypothetical protein
MIPSSKKNNTDDECRKKTEAGGQPGGDLPRCGKETKVVVKIV